MEEDVRYDIKIIDAKYLSAYKVWVKFSDNSEKVADLKDDLWGEVFEPLKDIEQFKKLRVNPVLRVLEWECGADIAPEHLYIIGTAV